jgi:SAM-dependent methyltransferase
MAPAAAGRKEMVQLMEALLYRELVPWYRLVDPTADHADEAACYRAALERATSFRPQTLLELGAGAGNNAFHLKRRFRCTLSDVSKEMLALSREINPECEHVVGDMRVLRLGTTFDAVLVHDAVVYMTTRADLAAAARTAFVHTRPGGAAVFAPDYVRETFRDDVEMLAGESGARALRGLEWAWDPDPGDDTYVVDYALLLRDGASVRAVHDRHVEGLFSIDTWRDILASVGYVVEPAERPPGDGQVDDIFVCRRPA